MQPATRKVVHRSPTLTVRLLHLPHLQSEPIEAESKLERDFVQIAALHPYIKSISHQPFKLVWEGRSYTPDFLLEFLDGSKLTTEVKPKSNTSEYEELFKMATEKLSSHRIEFIVATDEKITKNRSKNALLIRRYAKSNLNEETKKQILNLVESNPEGINVKRICENDPQKYAALLYLIGFRKLITNPELDISPDASIKKLVKHEEQNDAIHFTKWFND